MNPDQVKQIVETIKTLNLNLNDATTQKVADQIAPIAKMYFEFSLIKFGVWILVIMAIVGTVYSLINKILENEKLNIKTNGKDKRNEDYL